MREVRSAIDSHVVSRIVAISVAGLLALLALALVVARWEAVSARDYLGIDLVTYQAFARRFLETGSQYLPYQLIQVGYEARPLVDPTLVPSLYPPVAMLLFVPFLGLPAVLWWLVPGLVVGDSLRVWRPAVWSWPIIVAFIATPAAVTVPLVGSSTLWVIAFVAAGLRWRWPAAFLAFKPTFAPFAVMALGARTFWVAAAGILVLTIPMAAEWPRWFAAITGSSATLAYSITDLPLTLVPIVAWWASRTRRAAAAMDPRLGWIGSAAAITLAVMMAATGAAGWR